MIGRRNWLFTDTVAGANASANLYSLVETCKANGIDPYVYLVSLFRKLPAAKTADDFEALLPWRLTQGAQAISAQHALYRSRWTGITGHDAGISRNYSSQCPFSVGGQGGAICAFAAGHLITHE